MKINAKIDYSKDKKCISIIFDPNTCTEVPAEIEELFNADGTLKIENKEFFDINDLEN